MPRLLCAPALCLLTAATVFAADDSPKPDAPADSAEPRFADTIKPFFAPIATDRATIAPDGKHVAYTLHKGDTAYVMIMNVDRPDVKLPIALCEDRARPKAFGGQIDKTGVSAAEGVSANSMDSSGGLTTGDGGDSSTPMFYADEKTPATVPYLGWATANRLIMASDLPELFAIDADGNNSKKLVDLNDTNAMSASDINAPADAMPKGNAFIRRPFRVIDFVPGDRQHLLLYADGKDKDGLHGSTFKVDLTTGKLEELDENTMAPGTQVLADLTGKQRFEIATYTRTQTFRYHPIERSWKQSGDFGKVLGPDQIPFWKITPENYLGERAFPVAFDADPNILYYASNIGRDTYGLYAMDLRTFKRTDFAVEDAHYDLAALDGAFNSAPLVFDRATHKLAGVRLNGVRPATKWLDPRIDAVQHELDARFPSRFVHVLEWDDKAERFLVQVSSTSDPGRYYIYFRPEKKMMEFLRLAPELDPDALSITKPFEFDTPAGVHLTGYITQPSNTRSDPPPLLIYCHDGPSGRDLPAYNADAQALAAMGLVVAQVNYRGSDGFGRKHRDAGMAALDRAPVEDALAVADWVVAHQKIDRKRLAIYGVGFGGYIALRALQLAPDRFRCAITVDAPSDLGGWISHAQAQIDFADMNDGPRADRPVPTVDLGSPLKLSSRSPFPPKVDFAGELRAVMFGRDNKKLSEVSPFRHPELIQRPALIVQSRDNPALPPGLGTGLVDKLKKQGLTAEYLETGDEFAQRLPDASVTVFAKIEEFINYNVYDYNVKVGDTKVVK